MEELFVRLIQNHRKLPEVISLRSYLLRAFRNKLIDELRCPNQTVSLEENPETYFADSSIEELLNQQEFEERKRKLLLSLKMLPARQREILWLYYAEGLKHEEIAEGMQINYQSSKNLLFRAIVKLRELYFSLKGWILFFTIPYLS
ncbi:MAG: sigma-70 family RNA polymerase sigma factor [Odoribacter sp.]